MNVLQEVEQKLEALGTGNTPTQATPATPLGLAPDQVLELLHDTHCAVLRPW
jgi:hypothetical protein